MSTCVGIDIRNIEIKLEYSIKSKLVISHMPILSTKCIQQ